MEITKKRIKEIAAQFPNTPLTRVQSILERAETEKRALSSLIKEEKVFRAEKEQPAVEVLEIEIDWKKSKVWGMCPVASAHWKTGAGWNWEDRMARASGCGYDKESTVVAQIMNKLCKGMLWKKFRSRSKAPYGVTFDDFGAFFDGGVGMSCYYRIAKFLGGTLTHTASSKTYDKYVFEFK